MWLRKGKKLWQTLGIALFWLLLWELASLLVRRALLLPSPGTVACRLLALGQTWLFWRSACLSLLRILWGFLTGIVAGTLLGTLSAFSDGAGRLLAPLLTVVRATPVASFILLALVWMSAGQVPSFIAFLMVVPILWSNVKTGIRQTPTALKEVCAVYRIRGWRRIRLLYVPSVLPYFSAGLGTALGLAWKAGIAAEVLCTPAFSIGKMVYESKLYLETPDLFAWTAVVILLSVLLEKLLWMLLRPLSQASAQGGDKV